MKKATRDYAAEIAATLARVTAEHAQKQALLQRTLKAADTLRDQLIADAAQIAVLTELSAGG